MRSFITTIVGGRVRYTKTVWANGRPINDAELAWALGEDPTPPPAIEVATREPQNLGSNRLRT